MDLRKVYTIIAALIYLWKKYFLINTIKKCHGHYVFINTATLKLLKHNLFHATCLNSCQWGSCWFNKHRAWYSQPITKMPLIRHLGQGLGFDLLKISTFYSSSWNVAEATSALAIHADQKEWICRIDLVPSYTYCSFSLF